MIDAPFLSIKEKAIPIMIASRKNGIALIKHNSVLGWLSVRDCTNESNYITKYNRSKRDYSMFKKIVQIVVLSIMSLAAFLYAFIVGAQPNAFFAAIGFVSFFLVGVIAAHGVIRLVKGEDKKE